MKFTKKQFKSFSALVGAISLSATFGIGHLIANNEKIDNVNVITVPVFAYEYNTDFNNNIVGEYCIYTDYDFTLQVLNDFYTGNYVRMAYYTVDDEFACDMYICFSDRFTFLSGDYIVLSRLEQILGVTENLTTLSWHLELEVTDEVNPRLIYNINFTVNGVLRSYTSYTTLADKVSPLPREDVLEFNEVEDVNTLKLCFQLLESLKNNENTAYQEGIQYVLSHLNEFGLYNESEYFAYGAEQYNLGRGDAGNVLSIGELVREIFRAPISMFANAFNFVLPLPDGQNLNVGGILTFFLTIGIALTIVNLIMKIGGK